MNHINKGCEVNKHIKTRRNFFVYVKNIFMWRGYLYRTTMRIAHKFNWHYAPPIHLDRDTQLWCKW